MSINAPNFSRWVTFASITSPFLRLSKNSFLHFSCTLLRDSMANVLPKTSRSKPIMLKHMLLPTLEMSAISLTVPSSIPIAPSSRLIIPLITPKSICKLCSLSQRRTLPSIISFFIIAFLISSMLAKVLPSFSQHPSG